MALSVRPRLPAAAIISLQHVPHGPERPRLRRTAAALCGGRSNCASSAVSSEVSAAARKWVIDPQTALPRRQDLPGPGNCQKNPYSSSSANCRFSLRRGRQGKAFTPHYRFCGIAPGRQDRPGNERWRDCTHGGERSLLSRWAIIRDARPCYPRSAYIDMSLP